MSLTTTSASRTITLTGTEAQPVDRNASQHESAIIRLKKEKKKVVWKEDTIDNEGLGKKSSKCCCIYRKPHKFDESSSDSEQEDCDHCRGHVEKKNPTTGTR